MYSTTEIKNRCTSNDIVCFSVDITSEIVNKSIKFENIDEFFDFIKINNINQVFLAESYDEAIDYLITEDIIIEVIGTYGIDYVLNCLNSEIKKYNDSIAQLNFDIPKLILILCVYDGQIFMVCLENEFSFDGKELKNPSDVLQEIYELNVEPINASYDKLRYNVEEQKLKLEQYILNDEDFYYQANAHLRHNYTESLFDNVLTAEYRELKNHWSTPTGIPTKEFHDFVNLLWNKYGKKKK